MNANEKKFQYGEPIRAKEMPKSRKRLPQYDDCLREFLESGHTYWKVNVNTLPSQDVRVVLSSFKWRIKNKLEFNNIRVVMSKNQIYLEKVRSSE